MLVESAGCRGFGVDPKPDEIALARERSRALDDRIEWHARKIEEVDVGGGFDAAICIGATHAFGPPGAALEKTLEALRAYVKPGGRLLIGEGYWKQDPAESYLRGTGFSRSDLRTHDENGQAGERRGFRLVHQETSSLEEWDRFENAFLETAEACFQGDPDNTDARRDREHWRAWNARYYEEGRSTLGFGFYVFECQGPAA